MSSDETSSPGHEASRLLWEADRALGTGRLQAAIDGYERALGLFEQAGSEEGTAVSLTNLGAALHAVGRGDEAESAWARALLLHRRAGSRRLESIALANLGQHHLARAEHKQAAHELASALELHEAEGDQQRVASALVGLGLLHHDLQHLDQAAAHFDRAQAVARAAMDNRGEAEATLGRAALLLETGPLHEARRAYELARNTWRFIGDKASETPALTGLGVAALELGEDQALQLLDDAAWNAECCGDRLGEAFARGWLAVAFVQAGRLPEARGAWPADVDHPVVSAVLRVHEGHMLWAEGHVDSARERLVGGPPTASVRLALRALGRRLARQG